MKKLPIGYSSLQEVIGENCTYVDKTKFVKMMADSGKYYFLSRPRRFGKSLFLDTLKQTFLGNKKLFKGLYIEDKWDWSKQYPIIHISFGAGVIKSEENLDNTIHALLDRIFETYKIESRYSDVNTRFKWLIEQLSITTKNRVVILVDEYDKPILDNINNLPIAEKTREGLKNLYSVIKDCDQYIKFVFLTGVTKFSKVSLFSGINNLQDLTVDDRFADICGYTQADLERVFADRLNGVDKELLKQWYNGYSFGGSEEQKVYNPFDILLFFEKGNKYANYWFETATPTYLVGLMNKRKYYLPNLEKLQVTEELLGSFDIDKITIETLMFQSGYLTITKIVRSAFDNSSNYYLDFPNFEVRKSFNESLSLYLLDNVALFSNTKVKLTEALIKPDMDKLQVALSSFFSSIPYNWYVKNNIAEYEGFYATIMYSMFNSIGAIAIPEDATNTGRIDLAITLPHIIVLFEFKVNESTDTNSAFEQIKQKNYQEKYLNCHKPIYLVGVNFSSEKRNIVDYKWEQYVP